DAIAAAPPAAGVPFRTHRTVDRERPLAGGGGVSVRSARVRVERFQGAAADWDAVVAAQAGTTHCHAAAWREVIEDVLGHECVYLRACDDDGRSIGALPLVRVRSRLTGDRLLSMPFL